MCKTDGEAWRNSAIVDFSPGARSPLGATARVVARGSFRDALSTHDCFRNTKTSKKSAAAAHPYIQMDWRVRRLVSSSCILTGTRQRLRIKDRLELPPSLRGACAFNSDESSEFYITSGTNFQKFQSKLRDFHINLSRLGLLCFRQLQGQDSMLEVRGNFGLIDPFV